jgi:hypothetical protein
MVDPKLHDWLIVIFVHEYSGALAYQTQMKEAFERVGSNGNVVVFLILDSIVKGPDSNLLAFKLNLYKLDKRGSNGRWTFEEVHDKGFKKNENPDRHSWKTAFEYIYKNYFGERNMLITFSDGAAFGINLVQCPNDGPANLPESLASLTIPPDLEVKSNNYYMLDADEVGYLKKKDPEAAAGILKFENGGAIKKTAIPDFCKNLEILWVSELATALKEYVPTTIDIFLMCNCYMQLFDNGFMLEPKVKFLVAAEGYMDGDCYDFGKLMERVVYCPEVPSEVLIKGILKDLEEKYKNQRPPVDYLNNCTLYANRLKFYPLALRVFLGLVEDLMDLLDTDPLATSSELHAIRGPMQSVTRDPRYPMIDARLWVSNVCDKIIGITDEKKIYYNQQFRVLQEKIVLAKLSNKDYCTGISIYYPLTLAPQSNADVAFCAYFDKAVPKPFATESKWNKFLVKYYTVLAKNPPPAGNNPVGGGVPANPAVLQS